MSLAAHIRRAKHHGVAHERFEDEEIFERDGYQCQTCGKDCNKHVHVEDPDNPGPRALPDDAVTLGHEWPMGAGGPHFRWNCITQCWGCNKTQWREEDAGLIARIKRLAGVTMTQFARRAKRKAEGRAPLIPSPANAWRGQRGFPKNFRRRMNGKVEKING